MTEVASLDVLRCSTCGGLDPGPRDICAACHTPTLISSAVSGCGRLVSWTRIRRPPAAFKEDGPYVVGIVALDAGVQVTGRLAEPADGARPGARVHAIGLQRGVALFELS